MFTIARHRMLDAVRANRRRGGDRGTTRPVDDGVRSAADSRGGDPFEQVLDRQVLSGLLERLSVDQREVLWLRFFVDLDTAAVGRITGRSPNAVAALTARALTGLRHEATQAGIG